MSVEILLGPAGSGKTFRCLQQVRDTLLAAPEGPPLLFLAPKQATYQIERRLLTEFDVPGYHRLQIVSFDRLALFLLDHFGLPVPEALSEEGRTMVIRSLLLRHQGALAAFGASAKGPGFAQALSGWLRDLQQHQGSPNRLREKAQHPDTPPGLRRKLADAALVLDHYLAWLRERNLNDPDLALPLAAETLRERLVQTNTRPLGWLWVDGFAEFTPAELEILALTVRASTGATLAFCLPRHQIDTTSDFDLWSNIRDTFRSCYGRLATTGGSPIQLTELPGYSQLTRFGLNPVLNHIEVQLANLIPRPSSASAPEIERHLQLWHCPHPEAEAELAAQLVLEHVQGGGRYREIGIIPRTLQGYAAVFARVFRRYSIPLFVDQREAIGHHPAIELIRAAFRVLTKGWVQNDVFAVLKTGLAIRDSSQADRLENVALEFGWGRDHWLAPAGATTSGETERTRLQLVVPLQEFGTRLGAAPDGTTVADAITKLLTAWEVERQLDDWHLVNPDAPHDTVWKALESWQENIQLAFARDTLSMVEWAEIFESGLAGLSVGVLPPALDQVLMGTVDRSRNPELRLAIVPGMNDGIFPARPADPTILGQHETIWLESAGLGRSGVSLNRLAHERFFAYIAMTRSSERVVVSWSAASLQGKALEPSPIVRQLRQAFSALVAKNFTDNTIDSVRHPVQWLYSDFEWPSLSSPHLTSITAIPLLQRAVAVGWHTPPPQDQLQPGLSQALFGPRFRFSPSQLETFAKCPFQHFAIHGIACLERPQFETDARDRGSFEHAILASFHRVVSHRKLLWRELTPLEIERYLNEAVEMELLADGRGAFRGNAGAEYQTRAIQVRLGKLINRLVSSMASHAFDPMDVEVRVEVIHPTDSHEVQIRGRLDRIDQALLPGTDIGYSLIADYKSRARCFDEDGFYLGVDLQAPLYTAAVAGMRNAKGHPVRPAGWVWIPLNQKSERSDNRSPEDSQSSRPWMRGRLSIGALPLLSTNASVPSPFSIQLKKDGQPYATADLRQVDDLAQMLHYAEAIALAIGRLIAAGAAKASPLLRKGQLACEFCRAKEICRFDPQVTEPRVTAIFALELSGKAESCIE